MKRLTLFLFVALLSLSASAQTDSIPQLRFGYLSYDSALVSMPSYAMYRQGMSELREQYEQEMKRVEDEFNDKYEVFLEGQREFPRTILLKRQTELQQLMQRNIEFKAEAQRDLKKAEADGLQPLRTRLNEAIAEVAARHGLALVINTDSNACPFIDPALGISVEDEVKELLQKE